MNVTFVTGFVGKDPVYKEVGEKNTALGLIKDMAKVLRTAPMDGVSRLLEQAEAIENGVRTDSPNHVAMREALEQVAAYLDGLGGHEVMLGQIEAVVEGA